MEISWIKLKTKMFDDEKIQLIEAMPEADTILVVWIKLLILAGKTNENGDILLSKNIPYSPEMLSTIFRRPLQIVRFAIKTLNELGMIDVTENNVISICNWEKHQNVEGLDRVREQNRIRQAKYRERKTVLLAENAESVTLPNITVTEQNKSKKENKKKSIDYGTYLDKWNNFAKQHSLPTVLKLTPKRGSHIKQRLSENEFDFDVILDKIAKSDFARGKTDAKWKVNFDFIFGSANNYVKILEGNYDNRGNSTDKTTLTKQEMEAELKLLTPELRQAFQAKYSYNHPEQKYTRK